MKKFIILAGSPNSGKTISINLVINKLINNDFNVYQTFNDKSVDNFWTLLDKQDIPSKKSGSVCVEKNDKKIVLISYGDKDEPLKDLFNKINFEDYYAVICCSHATRGKRIFDLFHKIIGNIDLNKTQIIPIYKNLLSKHKNNNQENEHIANFIVSLI